MKTTYMQKNRLLFALASILLLAGCVKDPIYNTDHPNTAQVTLTADWSDKGTGITTPSIYIVSTGKIQEEVRENKYTLNNLFEPGSYEFFFYNPVSQISVTDGMAKVNTVTAQRTDEEIFIEAMPDWFFTGTLETRLEEDRDYELKTTFHQQVRQLTLILEIEGSTVQQINNIEGYLTGVAGELNIRNNTHNELSRVLMNFIKITEGADAGKWSVTVRLLGITGGVQKLIGTITSGGNSYSMALESDLSSALSNFNNDKKTPLTLGGQIIEVPTEAGFTATIRNWEKVTSGTGIAN